MEKSANALIIFLKNPVAGTVKTRLAADIGDERALQVYRRLVRHTCSVAENLGNTFIYFFYSDKLPAGNDHTTGFSDDDSVDNSDDAPDSDIIGNPQFGKLIHTRDSTKRGREYYYSVQHGKDLGERMLNAFLSVKNRGHSKICIIGTDCPELATQHLEQAFIDLQNHDLVIGPAADGGYYLLGMKKIERFLFMVKQWSTSSVLESTLESARKSGLTVTLLPELRDLDDISDLVYFPELVNPDIGTGNLRP